jgi:hypothetical protein
MSEPSPSWIDANQRYLSAALALVARHLEHKDDRAADAADAAALRAAETAMPAPPALELLRQSFDLTAFETAVLLMCAGFELDAQVAAGCAAATRAGAGHGQPTFKLALACFPGGHWDALSPGRPLRQHRLIEIGPGEALTTSPLRIDERVLHYLAGIRTGDPRLEDHLVFVEAPGADLPATHAALAEQIVARLAAASLAPAIELYGPDRDGKRALAAAVCERLGLGLLALPADLLGQSADDALLARLLAREAALDHCAVLIECDDLEGADAGAARRLIERCRAPLLISRRERGAPLRRPTLAFDVGRPTKVEQAALFRATLVPAALAAIDRVTAQFDLGSSAIRAACAAAAGARVDGEDAERAVWDACRTQTRARLDELAQRIESRVGWDDLALPPPQLRALREIAVRVRWRTQVHDVWGFADKSSRGLGIGALFSGPSGTGKTLAAEVLANELRLDLYRVDLSQVVSKYIGETEKNLRRVFDAAEEGAAVLLFDEADALFGKRSEVRDSHDRYANVEVSYLLQRVEAYRGLAILTTNLRAAIDAAFLRRLAFVVEFPFPDAALRSQIWRRVFPPSTPTEGLDWEGLARLNLSGGNIRNIALGAAFLAADAGEPVRMAHVHRACEGEYLKLERSLPPELTPRLDTRAAPARR